MFVPRQLQCLVRPSFRLFVRRSHFCGFRAFPDKQLEGLITNLVDIFIIRKSKDYVYIMLLPRPDQFLFTLRWILAGC